MIGKLNRTALEFAHRGGLFTGIHRAWRKRLTVLAYHRIDEPGGTHANGFEPNISASANVFQEQIEFLRRRFTMVSVQDVAAWLAGKAELPPHAALITFDDGYLDNYTNAFPVLNKLGVPAVIFIASDCVDGNHAFYWDEVAYLFSHTEKRGAEIPLLGERSWQGPEERRSLAHAFVYAAKKLSPSERQDRVGELAGILDLEMTREVWGRLYMTWDHVREMSKAGIEFGGHTRSHPILSRLSVAEASREISEGKQRIEQETGKQLISFAYPNGLQGDFTEDHKDILRRLGFEIAFSLMSGPAGVHEVMEDPLAIRRIFVSSRDSMPRFHAKLTGMSRLFH